MQQVNLETVIRYARERHGIPASYARTFYNYWTERGWVNSRGRIIYNWQTKFDWWAQDHKNRLIITPNDRNEMIRQEEIQRKELQRQKRDQEKTISYDEYLRLKASAQNS